MSLPSESYAAALPIVSLTLLPSLVVRMPWGGLDELAYREDLVEDYADLIADGMDLGPLQVVLEQQSRSQRRNRRLLADGYQRLEAFRRLGYTTVHCSVRSGDERTALLVAMEANGRHGRAYSPSEKRRLVETLLTKLGSRHDEWPDEALAPQVGLPRKTVARVRAFLIEQIILPATSPDDRTTAPDTPVQQTHATTLNDTTAPGSRARMSGFTAPSAPLRSMEPTTEQLTPQQINLTTAAVADELDFVIGWRHIRAGHMLSQGAANHMTSVTELPEALRAALLAWLT